MSTKVYGQFDFKGKVKAIRHVLTPNIGMSYTPDFSDPIWGYYQTYQSDTEEASAPHLSTTRIYMVPGKRDAGKCQLWSTKHLGDEGQKQERFHGQTKVKLLEGLSVNTSWNAAATSFQWVQLIAPHFCFGWTGPVHF